MKNKIIFIEDNKEHFEKYSKWMDIAGYEVNTWDESEAFRNNFKNSDNLEYNFRDWLQRINQNNNVIAFVLDIKINLKQYDGLDIQKLIRRDELSTISPKYQKMPIVILTSNKDKDIEAHQIASESPDRFIVKEETNEKSFTNKLNFEIRKYNLNITSEEIYKIVQDTNNKVTELGVVSKMIAKTLPNMVDKSKANKIIKEWKEDTEFQKIMDGSFPSKKQGLFKRLEKFVTLFKDEANKNIADALYEQAVIYFEKEAEIDGDDTKMVQFLKYSAYIVEKIGEAVHKR